MCPLSPPASSGTTTRTSRPTRRSARWRGCARSGSGSSTAPKLSAAPVLPAHAHELLDRVPSLGCAERDTVSPDERGLPRGERGHPLDAALPACRALRLARCGALRAPSGARRVRRLGDRAEEHALGLPLPDVVARLPALRGPRGRGEAALD